MNRRVLAAEQWGDAQTPACRCGCGEPVGFKAGGPKLYANRAHAIWDGIYLQLPHGHFYGEVVAIEQFRAAVRKIKVAKGWTWEETAVRGGWSRGRLNGVMFGGRNQFILRKTARAYLSRLAGMPGEMTAWERREVEREVAAGRRAGADIERRYMRSR